MARRPAPRFLERPRRLPESEEENLELAELVAAHAALVDEPECVGPGILDAYGRDSLAVARTRHAVAVAEALVLRPALPWRARLADAERRARAHHVDVGHDLRAVRRALEAAGVGGRREPATALTRLAAVESRLDDLDAPRAA